MGRGYADGNKVSKSFFASFCSQKEGLPYARRACPLTSIAACRGISNDTGVDSSVLNATTPNAIEKSISIGVAWFDIAMLMVSDAAPADTPSVIETCWMVA